MMMMVMMYGIAHDGDSRAIMMVVMMMVIAMLMVRGWRRRRRKIRSRMPTTQIPTCC